MKRKFTQQGLITLAAITVAGAVTPVSMIRSYEHEISQHQVIREQVTVEEVLTPHRGDTAVENPVDNYVDYVENSETSVEVEVPIFTEQELETLAIIIYQEAGADKCSDDTRRKVGSVFLNRVNSTMFPDTFEEVATQERQYGTLYWTGIKWPKRASMEQEAHAVERAYNIAEELLTDGSILPGNVIYQAEFVQGDGIYCYQDNIYFCYTEEN